MSNSKNPPTTGTPSAASPDGIAERPPVKRYAHIKYKGHALLVPIITPDQLVASVLNALGPKYDIDGHHQVALCNVISQAFEGYTVTMGISSPAVPEIVVSQFPPGSSALEPAKHHHNGRKKSSAVSDHYDRMRQPHHTSGSTRGGYGPPQTINGAFYFSDDHPDYKKLFPGQHLSTQENKKPSETPSSLSPRRTSPPKRHQQRLNRPTLPRGGACATMSSNSSVDEGSSSNNMSRAAQAVDMSESEQDAEPKINEAVNSNATSAPDVFMIVGEATHETVHVNTKQCGSVGDLNDTHMATGSFDDVDHADDAASHEKTGCGSKCFPHGSTMDHPGTTFYDPNADQADNDDNKSDGIVPSPNQFVAQPLETKDMGSVNIASGSSMNTTTPSYQANDENNHSVPEPSICAPPLPKIQISSCTDELNHASDGIKDTDNDLAPELKGFGQTGYGISNSSYLNVNPNIPKLCGPSRTPKALASTTPARPIWVGASAPTTTQTSILGKRRSSHEEAAMDKSSKRLKFMDTLN